MSFRTPKGPAGDLHGDAGGDAVVARGKGAELVNVERRLEETEAAIRRITLHDPTGTGFAALLCLLVGGASFVVGLGDRDSSDALLVATLFVGLGGLLSAIFWGQRGLYHKKAVLEDELAALVRRRDELRGETGPGKS